MIDGLLLPKQEGKSLRRRLITFFQCKLLTCIVRASFRLCSQKSIVVDNASQTAATFPTTYDSTTMVSYSSNMGYTISDYDSGIVSAVTDAHADSKGKRI